MGHHLYNLLKAAVSGMPALVSSNWLAWGLGLFVFATYELLALVFRGWEDMKLRWKQNVGMGIGAAFIGYVVLFGISVVKTVYDDHQSLVTKVAGLESKKSEARNDIAQLADEGSAIRDSWQAFIRNHSSQNLDQSKYADKARRWHVKITNYLHTVPRGSNYIARLNAAPLSACEGYPPGHDPKTCTDLSRLSADLNSLADFIKDPDLGK